jgi:hypothetical protein
MFRRGIASLLILSLALPLPAQAGLVATDAAVRAEHHERVSRLLERADLQAQLRGYGVSAADVQARVAALTDEEAAQLAARIESLPAGGESIIGAILIVFIVLLITDILGFTKVFPFTRSVK